jgi:hypothetical protein
MIVQVLSNESVNDRGYVVMNNSIDWGRYRKNPVLMLQHFQWDNPIGSVKDIKLNTKKKRWEGILVFASTKEGQKYKQMYEEGSYNAVSIAGKVEFAERKGKKFTTKFEVYEISLVAIPSNEDAVAIREKNAKLGCLPVEFCITESQQVEQLSADFETEINNYLSMEEKEEKLEKAPEKEEIQQEVQGKENLSSGLSGILSRFEEKLSSLLGKKEEDQNPVKEEKLESEEDEKEKLSSEIEKEPEQEKLAINPEEKTLSFDKSNQIMANYTSLNDYLSDKSKASKVVRMTRLSAKATDSELLSVQDDLKEISSVMLNDEKLMSALGQIRISNPKRGEMSLNEMLTAIVNDHEMLQAGGKTYPFMGDPDLAVVNWIGLFFRLLFPVNTFADRIPRISSTQAGTIHVQSKYNPAVYYGNNVPASQATPYSYDDAAIAIPTRVFSLQPTLFQQANDDMLNYDKRGWGMAEALRVISNAAHNYYLQTIATAAADNKVTMSGTEYFASAGMFPANTSAAGDITKITVTDILNLSSLFRNQNFNFDYEYPEVILDSVYYNQLIADSSFVNLLNRPTESIRPMGTTAYNFEIHARSITSLWNTATSAIVDPKLYGIPLESNGNIPASYNPPTLAVTAYGLGIGFFPSQVIIGIGNTHVHMVQDPTRYGWMFSMDFRTGCGAAREDGVGTGLIVPAAKNAG